MTDEIEHAIIQAMADAYYDMTAADEKAEFCGLRGILDAIRAGKVPTICNLTTNEMTLQAERDALMVQIKILKGSLEASREMGRKAQTEADGLRSEVEREKARADKAEAANVEHQEVHEQVAQRCYAALESVGITEQPDGGGQPDYILPSIVEGSLILIADLVASEKARADKAEKELAEEADWWKHHQAEREQHWYDRLGRADDGWRQEKARADKATAERDQLRAEVERLTAERDAAQRQVIGVMICTAINGADWIGEKLDSGERPSWQDALDMVEKLKAKLMAERDAEKSRADEMKADGERAVMEERERTAKAAAECDRLRAEVERLNADLEYAGSAGHVDNASRAAADEARAESRQRICDLEEEARALAAERDRLAGLLREARGFVSISADQYSPNSNLAAEIERRIDAALAEVGA